MMGRPSGQERDAEDRSPSPLFAFPVLRQPSITLDQREAARMLMIKYAQCMVTLSPFWGKDFPSLRGRKRGEDDERKTSVGCARRLAQPISARTHPGAS